MTFQSSRVYSSFVKQRDIVTSAIDAAGALNISQSQVCHCKKTSDPVIKKLIVKSVKAMSAGGRSLGCASHKEQHERSDIRLCFASVEFKRLLKLSACWGGTSMVKKPFTTVGKPVDTS
jgi:hypothetical protein